MGIELVAQGRIAKNETHRIRSFDRFDLMQPGDLIVLGFAGVIDPLIDTRPTWLITYMQHEIHGNPPRHAYTGYWQAPDDVPVDTTVLGTNILDFHPQGYVGINYAIYRNVTAIGTPVPDSHLFPAGSADSFEFTEFSVPAEPARAAIAVFFEESFGVVPGKTFSTPEWTPVIQGGGRASCSIFLWQSASGDPEPIPGYGFKTIGSGGSFMSGHIFAVDYIPVVVPSESNVTRQWPRDDAQGVSSSPRIWPASKSARMAGGYPGGAGG
jgi:hypothetical protein